MVRTTAWPGLRDAGKLPPETEKPVPVVASDLMFTGALPVEVTVTDFVTAVPTATSPNCRDAELRLSAADDAPVFDGFSWIETLRDVPLEVATIVAVCVVDVAATVATNEAVVEPLAIVAVAGTTTALLVLLRATESGFDDFALNDRAQVVFPAALNEVVVQESDLSSGAPAAAVAGEREMENDFEVLP